MRKPPANGGFHETRYASPRLHDSHLQLVFPYYIGRFERLNADLSGVLRVGHSDPDDLIAGALVMSLQPDGLSDLSDAADGHNPGPDERDFIGTAQLTIGAVRIQKNLYGHGNINAFLAPRIDCRNRGGAREPTRLCF